MRGGGGNDSTGSHDGSRKVALRPERRPESTCVKRAGVRCGGGHKKERPGPRSPGRQVLPADYLLGAAGCLTNVIGSLVKPDPLIVPVISVGCTTAVMVNGVMPAGLATMVMFGAL